MAGQINTGKGTISLITLISVLSLSLVVNIPGLAISPIIGTIKTTFKASDLEVQLLTMLPNICIIPTMLLSSQFIKWCGKTVTTIYALSIFLITGICFFLVNGILGLILLSCVMGMACGVIIPIAASMIADLFFGKYRVKELGIKSGIANISLVVATFVVGWLSQCTNWRLPFLVYLIPVIPLLFIHGVKKAEKLSKWNIDSASVAQESSTPQAEGQVNKWHMAALMGLYFFVTFTVMVLPYYLGLDQSKLKINDEWNGTITSIFYLMIFLGGAFLFYFIKIFKGLTLIIAAACMTLGILFMVAGIKPELMCVCGALMGIGYGIFQPVIYNKTAEVAQNKRGSNMALSWVMCMNYLSVAIAPVLIDSIRALFNTNSDIFPFFLTGTLCGAFTIFIIFRRNTFAFSIGEEYY